MDRGRQQQELRAKSRYWRSPELSAMLFWLPCRHAIEQRFDPVTYPRLLPTLALIAFTAFAPAPSHAQTLQYQVMIDADRDAATGCSVTPTGGAALGGFEHRLLATVDAAGAQVTALERQDCNGAAFGGAVPVTQPATPPWPVGLNTGTAGADVIELGVASGEVASPFALSLRLAFVADDGSGSDVLATVDGSNTGEQIILGLPSNAIQIPTMSIAGIVMLLLAVVVLGWMAQRRLGRFGAMSAVLLFAGLVWAMNFMLDGDPVDWTGVPPAGQDPAGDGTDANAGNDILAGFAAVENGNLFFRIDASDIENQAPVANDDDYTTDEDAPLNVAAPGVLGNDSDADSDPITSVLDTGPANAESFTLNADGSFDYVPGADFNGSDSFTYFANDGQVDSAAATVTITINAVNDAPSAQDDPATTDEDQPVVVDVLANDSDIDGSLDPASVNVSSGPSNGTTSVDPATGEITYTKSGDFNGSDSFVYEVCDDGTPLPAECATATVSVTVAPVNDDPTISSISDQTIPEDGSTGALGFTVGDTDSAAGDLVVTATSSNSTLVPDANISLGGSGENRTVTVTPAADANGSTEITLTVTDPDSGSALTVFQVTVTADNDAPTISAVADQTLLEDGTTGALAFTVDDADTAVGSLTVTAASSDTTRIPEANLVLGGSGANRTVTVTPAADRNGGPVTITLTVQDGDGGSTPTQFGVTVTPVNDEPTLSLGGDQTVDEDAGAQSVAGFAAVSPGAANEAGQVVTLTLTNDNNALFSAQPAIDPSTGELTYAPAPDANGSATVSVTAMDNGGTANGGDDTAPTQMFTITVNPVNDPPTAADDGFTVVEDSTDNPLDVLANDTDAPDTGETLTITAVGTPDQGGAVSIAVGGTSLSYTPAADFAGTETFTYTIGDGNGGMDTATVSVTVTDINDPPTANDDGFTVDEDSSNNALDVLANDSFAPDTGETLSITAVGTPDQSGSVSITGGGTSLSYTPASDFVGTETFSYTISDGNGGSDMATVTVMVQNANDDPPVCSADSGLTDEDTSTLVDVLANDADPDPGQTATLTISAVNTTGTMGAVVNNGTDVSYDPNGQFESLGAGDQANDSFSYTAQDSDGLTCMATVTVTITGVDDPAVTANDFYRTVGNTLLEVDDAQDDPQPSVFVTGSVLDNDNDPDSALSVTGTSNVTAGAVVSMAADGTFTYVPPAGLRGDGNPATADDSFDYQLSGGEIATVSIDIDDFVWYVDNQQAGPGSGRSTDPFSTLAAAEAASSANDFIYVFYQGDPTPGPDDYDFIGLDAGITLKDGQTLLGEAVDLVVGIQTLYTGNAARRTSLTHTAGDVVTLADDNQVAGLRLYPVASAGVAGGPSVTSGTTTIRNVHVLPASASDGFTFNGQSGTLTMDDILVDGLAGNMGTGVFIENASMLAFNSNAMDIRDTGVGLAVIGGAGSGMFADLSISNTAIRGFDADGGSMSLDITLDGTTGINTGSQTVRIRNRTAGNVTFQGTGGSITGGNISILGNTGGNIAFNNSVDITDSTLGGVTADVNSNPAISFADLDIISTGVNGLDINNTNFFTLTTGTVTTTDAIGVDISNINNALNGTLTSTTVNNSAGRGIQIVNVAGFGTFNLENIDITTSNGEGVVTNGAGTLNINAGGAGTASVDSTNSRALDMNNHGGTAVFTNLASSGSAIGNVDLTTLTGAFTAQACNLDSSGGTGFNAVSVVSLTVNAMGSNTCSVTASGRAVNIQNSGNAVVFTNVDVSSSTTGGINLTTNTGTTEFDAMSIATTGGVGLLASSAGSVIIDAGTLTAMNGPALEISSTAMDMQISLARSIGSGSTGIDITGATGTGVTIDSVDVDDTSGVGVQLSNNSAPIAINGGTVGETVTTGTTTGGNGVDIDGGSAAVTVAAAVTNTTARSVEVTNRAGGTVTVSGAINDTGTGINVASNSAGFTVFSSASKVLNTGANNAVTLASNTGHTVQFTNGGLNIDTTTGTGFTATGGGTVEVGGASNTVDVSGAAFAGINFVNTSIGASGVTFSTVNVNGAADGINLTQPGAGDFAALGGTIQNITTRGVDVSGGNGDVRVDASIDTTTTGRSVEVTTHTGGTVDFNGFIDDDGIGVRLENNVGSILRFDGGMDVDTAATSGTEEGFQATGGGTVHVTGTNDVNTSLAVGIAVNIAAGTTIGSDGVTFRSVSADGADAGIVLTSTGSIGDFEVTGDGASSTADTTAGRTTAAQGGGSLTLGSGGTITGTTDGVRLTSSTDVFLRNMVIGESAAMPTDAVSGTTVITDNGIEVSSVNNLVLDNVLLSQTGDHGIEGSGANVGLTLIHTEILNAGDNGAGPTDGDDAMDFSTGAGAPLTGTVTIQSSILAGMSDTGLEVENFSGNLDLTVTDSFIGNNDHSDGNCNPCEGDGFLLRADGGSATIDMVVRDTTFNDIANDGIDLGNDGASNVSTLIAEDIIGSNNNGADNLIDTANTEGDLEVRITDLTSDSAHRGTVLFFKADGAASTDVTINTSGASPNLIQGSTIGAGVQMFVDGDPGTGVLANGNARLLIENTDISNHFSEGVSLIVQDMSSAAGTLDATLDDVTTQKPSRADNTIVGSLDFVAGGGGDGTLQFELINSSIGEGSDFFGSATEGLVLRGDRQINVACVDDGNGGNGTPCTNIGNLTSDDNLAASVMNENGNQVAGGSFAGADVFTSAALRSGSGELLIANPAVVTNPTLP